MRSRALLVVLTVVTVVVLVAAADVGGVRAHLGVDPSATSSPNGVAPADTGKGDVSSLDPKLAHAVERAQELARSEGVELLVNSGWRSRAHQQRLYDEAIEKYGSPEAARQWVLPPDESAHVQGDAVDVGPPAAARWLEENGEQYGLCRVYDNEPWHFERLAGAVGSTCPARLPHA
jgi:D-alanyl-D-alanine carboxypeptidase